ncbi:hypothetical protein LTR08_006404 [Meristemomyces frigidus]|nr:hypothetical protein LTR08_006404 [Meristemomyces frigidus]
MSEPISNDSDYALVNTNQKRPSTSSRKSERLNKKVKISGDMNDWKATEALLNELSDNFHTLKASSDADVSRASGNQQTIVELKKENGELKRLARERQCQISPLQLNLQAAEEEVQLGDERIAAWKRSIIRADLIQIAELEQVVGHMSVERITERIEIRNLQERYARQGSTLKVMEAAKMVRTASMGMNGQTMGQFGSALDGLREALQLQEEDTASLDGY